MNFLQSKLTVRPINFFLVFLMTVSFIPSSLLTAYASTNTPPTISITEPSSLQQSVSSSFTISWTDSDPDDNALISLYFDTDNQGLDGIAIINEIEEDDSTNQFVWDTSHIEPGEYYIYGIIEDGINDPVIAYSAGTVLIDGSAYIPSGFTTAGSTDGNFQVSPTGAATYSIPISISPGTGGVEPELSLNYNSQGGNGLLGVGWSLGGLSAITRCPATVAQDGFKAGIAFSTNDRFCLDGKRLMAVSGTYGADRTEYRTEIDTFSKVISYSNSTHPEYFTVETKAGLTMTYGNTDDSKVKKLNGSNISTWHVNKIEDSVGNYMTFNYEKESGVLETRVSEILYGGNSLTGLQPNSSIIFLYEDRPDISHGNFSEDRTRLSKRLKKIEAKHSGQIVRSYNLKYEQDTLANRSQLTQIEECGNDATCFQPTTFSWTPSIGMQRSSSLLSPSGLPSSLQHSNNTYRVHPGDFNGDGITDIFKSHDNDGWNLMSLAKNDGTFESPIVIDHVYQHSNNTYRAHIADFNGDGMSDILKTHDSGTNSVFLSNGDGIFSAPKTFVGHWEHSNGTYRAYLGDFNGDGMMDVLSAYQNAVNYIGFSKGNGKFRSSISFNAHLYNSNNIYRPHIADFNGDGMSDILMTHDSGNNSVRLSNGDGTFSAPIIFVGAWEHSNGTYKAHLGDFNGDGMMDVLSTYQNAVNYIGFSKGNGKFRSSISFNAHLYHSSNIYRPHIADFNGDGISDILMTHDSATNSFRLSNGDGTFTSPIIFQSQLQHSNNTYRMHIGDFNGDGSVDILKTHDTAGQNYVFLYNEGQHPRTIINITNGNNFTIDITYKPLTDSSIYTKGTSANYPAVDVQTPMYVVSSYSIDNLRGGTNTMSYAYEQAMVDLHGRGLLGFGSVTSTDQATGITSNVEYSTQFPYIGMRTQATKKTQSGNIISQTTNTLSNTDLSNGVYFPYTASSTSSSYDLDTSLINTVTTTTTYDTYGNTTQIITDYGNGTIDTQTNTFTNDVTNWHLGRLTTSEVTAEVTGKTTQTRTSHFEYNSTTGLLTKEIVEPGNATLELTKTYTHDVYGNILTSTTTGPNITARSTTSTYDSLGRFEVTNANDLGHTETKEYDGLLGLVTKITGPNGLETTWEYDGFGRQLTETRADGTKSHTRYILCDQSFSCSHPDAHYVVWNIQSGMAPSIVSFDKLDRKIREESTSLNGTKVFVDYEYNALGQLERQTTPYFSGDVPLWTSFTYDVLGREITTQLSDNSTIQTSYNGLETSVTNDKNQTTKRIVDTRGNLAQVIDSDNNSINYEYDVFGNMVSVTDPANNQTVLTYDIIGNKLSLNDPSTGLTTYTYNALGEVISQTDAANQTVTFTYDTLARLTQRTQPEGTTTWTYDTGNKAIGKLSQVSTTAHNYQQDFSYDNLGRPVTKTTTIDSIAYTTSTSYDELSRAHSITYPTGFTAKNTYNQFGYQNEVRNNSSNALLWRLNQANARGQSVDQLFGNGVTTINGFNQHNGLLTEVDSTKDATVIQDLSFAYDTIGNLTSRSDNEQSISETFGYDTLNRLASAQVAGQTAVTSSYDAVGNITSRSDVGNYTYGQNGAGPYAVTSISGTVNATYSYDAVGNRLTPTNNTGSITYTSFNKPVSITEGNTSVSFKYDPDYSFFEKTTDISSGTKVSTTTYVDGLYEKLVTTENSVTSTSHKHFISGSKGLVAIYTEHDTDSNGVIDSNTTIFIHKDHLGSTQSITDETGVRVEQLNYDAWGRRRTSAWQVAPLGSITSETTKGFTGHEQLDEVSLIHMDGRVYDPVIGRVLSADPFVQEPENSQNLNRYSYVVNNPLSNVDPDGYFFRSLFKALNKVIEKVSDITSIPESVFHAAIIIGAGVACSGSPYCSAAAASALSYGSGASLGDSIKAGVITGVTAGAFDYVGTTFEIEAVAKFNTKLYGAPKVIAHGVVGGTSSVLQGGKFGHGFIAAGMGELFSPITNQGGTIYQTIAASVVGGTAAELSGGKFANGAVTAGFGRLFNKCAHEGCFGDKPYPDDFFPARGDEWGMLSEGKVVPDGHFSPFPIPVAKPSAEYRLRLIDSRINSQQDHILSNIGLRELEHLAGIDADSRWFLIEVVLQHLNNPRAFQELQSAQNHLSVHHSTAEYYKLEDTRANIIFETQK